MIPTAQQNKCPNCGKEEDTVFVCRHCGYEYQDDQGDLLFILVIVIILSVCVWVGVTIVVWVLDYTPQGKTLLDLLKDQVNFLKRLRLY